MATFNDIVDKIQDYIYIQGDYACDNFFNNIGGMLDGVDLTADQICSLISILHEVQEDLLDNNDTLAENPEYCVEDVVESKLFTKLVNVSEDDLERVVSVLYDNYGESGLNRLVYRNFLVIHSFKLFLLIMIKEERIKVKRHWVNLILDRNTNYFRFKRRHGEKIKILFGWMVE